MELSSSAVSEGVGKAFFHRSHSYLLSFSRGKGGIRLSWTWQIHTKSGEELSGRFSTSGRAGQSRTRRHRAGPCLPVPEARSESLQCRGRGGAEGPLLHLLRRGGPAGAAAGPGRGWGRSRGLAARRRPRPGDSPESGGAGRLEPGTPRPPCARRCRQPPWRSGKHRAEPRRRRSMRRAGPGGAGARGRRRCGVRERGVGVGVWGQPRARFPPCGCREPFLGTPPA